MGIIFSFFLSFVLSIPNWAFVFIGEDNIDADDRERKKGE